jgi:hypothetical protein
LQRNLNILIRLARVELETAEAARREEKSLAKSP